MNFNNVTELNKVSIYELLHFCINNLMKLNISSFHIHIIDYTSLTVRIELKNKQNCFYLSVHEMLLWTPNN